jgi:hybrid cluster-associated redox disulfide protein
MEAKIKKDMLIGDFVQQFPQAVETLLEEGVHCVGCGASHFETIEQGLAVHGKTGDEIDAVVEKLNKAIENATQKSDKALIISEHAANKVKELLQKDHKEGWGLRIRVIPGGCSGLSMSLALMKSHMMMTRLSR